MDRLRPGIVGCNDARHMQTLHLKAFIARLEELVNGEIAIEAMHLVGALEIGALRR